MGTNGEPQRPRLVHVPAALTVLVLVLAVLAAGSMGDFSARPVLDAPAIPSGPLVAPSPSAGPPEEILAGDGERLVIGGDLAVAALLLVAVAALALLVRYLLRFRAAPTAGDRRSDQAALLPPGPPAPTADPLPAWTEAFRAALTGDTDTSDAVIRCWLDLERLCAEAGVRRGPAQTSTDFAGAAAAALDLPARPLVTLNRLYQRARFGQTRGDRPSLPLGPADRERAAAAVGELASALAARPAVTS
ncbi:hypothetical protein MN0502_21350 [Arthrobacter sp. MN05-02]|nr:hypothetical protein MN0502_21350 [Arthrobacter sp. MN05-02]